MPRKSQTRKKQTRLAFAPVAPTDGDDSDNDDRHRTLRYDHPTMASVRSKSPRKQKPVPAKEKKSNTSLKAKAPESEVKMAEPEPEPEPELPPPPQDVSSDEDDIVIPSSHRKRKTPISPSETTPRAKGRLKRKAPSSPIILIGSDDEDEPVVSSPVKRRRRFANSETPEMPKAGTTQDDLEVAEDVKDLQDSDDSGKIPPTQLSLFLSLSLFFFFFLARSSYLTIDLRETRTRGRIANSARSKRMMHLETLRRRRAGGKSESESEHDLKHDVDEDSDTQDHGSDNDSIIDNEDLDTYDEDFIEDNDAFGVPTDVPFEEIPLEYTHHACKKPKESFRDVVGWMVHNYLDPAFPRSDGMYRLAFKKINDEVYGRASSQLMSSVWISDFRNALRARPRMELTPFKSILGSESCEACNRSGHPVSWEMKLYGKPYSEETLESLEESDDTDEEKEGQSGDETAQSGVDYDREGHALPNENRRFLLGR